MPSTSHPLPQNVYNAPIPRLKPLDWEKVYSGAIAENEEALIPASLMPERILVRPQYYFQGVAHALPECYIRKQVFQRLVAASMNLPSGFKLVIFDSWRPVALQQTFFTTFVEELRQAHPETSLSDLETMASAFVARPSANAETPSPHLTGGAVDLSVVDVTGMPVEMGTEFDETVPASFTRYYEEKIEAGEPLTDDEWGFAQNRRLLFHAMSSAGFTNFPNEWWHFDYGNQLWAYMTDSVDAVPVYGLAAVHNRW